MRAVRGQKGSGTEIRQGLLIQRFDAPTPGGVLPNSLGRNRGRQIGDKPGETGNELNTYSERIEGLTRAARKETSIEAGCNSLSALRTGRSLQVWGHTVQIRGMQATRKSGDSPPNSTFTVG